MANIGIDLPGGLPYQPWLVPIVKERTDNLAKDDPHIKCLPDNFLRAYGLPHLLKFVHTPNLLVVLNEMNAGYRQVFTDARPLPADPTPSWQGYSSAKWSGDTLVIDTIGLRDDTWIDWNGSVVTEQAKVREQIRRLRHLVLGGELAAHRDPEHEHPCQRNQPDDGEGCNDCLLHGSASGCREGWAASKAGCFMQVA